MKCQEEKNDIHTFTFLNKQKKYNSPSEFRCYWTLPSLMLNRNEIKLSKTVIVCLSTITSGLAETNLQFIEQDVKIFQFYMLFMPTADARHIMPLFSLPAVSSRPQSHSPDQGCCKSPLYCLPSFQNSILEQCSVPDQCPAVFAGKRLRPVELADYLCDLRSQFRQTPVPLIETLTSGNILQITPLM